MSMVFLLEKDKEGTYRVKPVQAKSVPVIICREEKKLVLLTPIPATKEEVEAYAAKYIREPVEPVLVKETPPAVAEGDEVDVIEDSGDPFEDTNGSD